MNISKKFLSYLINKLQVYQITTLGQLIVPNGKKLIDLIYFKIIHKKIIL